ncbi:MAG: nitronate monooxygenase [Hyphomonadaceae bacterium]|nr:nitronate monooxygenase [Hyphomonadaceae bacterium]
MDEWLGEIDAGVDGMPYAVNLITHRTNKRLDADLDVVINRRTPIIITSVGAPQGILERVHAYGGHVVSDVASIRHAQKAAQSGVDGMVLLCAGAGGQTGTLNPFAFIEAVREFYDGVLIVAGSITNGRQLAALELLGADLGYAGTSFIVSEEANADEEYRQALAESTADDVMETNALTGIPVNILERSAQVFGITKQNRWQPEGGGASYDAANIKWRKGSMTAGHGVGAVKQAHVACAAIVEQFVRDYESARSPGIRAARV